MEQGKGTISENELMNRLVRAKKVMTAVDTGEYKPGNINENSFDEPLIDIPEAYTQAPQYSPQIKNKQILVNEDKIKNSKLPDAIKDAMIKHPIQVPSFNMTDNLDMKIFEGAKRLMNEDNIPSKHSKPQLKKPITNSPVINNEDLVSRLTPIIENTIRKILDEKLTQILTAHDTGTINENLVLKVGDSIFSGKITKVKSATKK